MMNRIYTIYHIPEFVYSDGSIGKIGVSYKLTSRINQNLKKSLEGFTNWEVLEEHKDVYKVSDREIELQKQYGYKVDTTPYWKMVKMPTKEGRIKGGKNSDGRPGGLIGGKKTAKRQSETGQLHKIHLARRRAIYQCDKSGKIIKEFEYITQAAKTLNLPQGNIHKVLDGSRNFCGGYTFKYKEV